MRVYRASLVDVSWLLHGVARLWQPAHTGPWTKMASVLTLTLRILSNLHIKLVRSLLAVAIYLAIYVHNSSCAIP